MSKISKHKLEKVKEILFENLEKSNIPKSEYYNQLNLDNTIDTKYQVIFFENIIPDKAYNLITFITIFKQLIMHTVVIVFLFSIASLLNNKYIFCLYLIYIIFAILNDNINKMQLKLIKKLFKRVEDETKKHR